MMAPKSRRQIFNPCIGIMITINLSELDDALKPLASRSNNRVPLMRTIAGILRFGISENFRTEGKRLSGANTPWKPLAPRTIRERKRLKLWPGLILARHGASGLEGSFSQKWGNDFAQSGTNKTYAALMNLGGTVQMPARSEIFERLRFSKGKKKGKFKKLADDRAVKKGLTFKAHSFVVPPRPFLRLADEDLKKIKSAVASYLTR